MFGAIHHGFDSCSQQQQMISMTLAAHDIRKHCYAKCTGKSYACHVAQQVCSATLQGLEDLEELNGLAYKDLPPERQDIFNLCEISLRIVQTKADEDGLFELYTRMNTGSKNHSKQQNRRAIFRYKLSS